jgi:prepilin-type processing-associated H-X9-DG protein
MRQWAFALVMYEGDYKNCVPPYMLGLPQGGGIGPVWPVLLAPYVVSQVADVPAVYLATNGIWNQAALRAESRKCPAGSQALAPFLSPTSLYRQPAYIAGGLGWNCWVGVYLGSNTVPLTGTLAMSSLGSGSEFDGPTLSAATIRNPSEAMVYMDTATDSVLSPLVWPFDLGAGNFGQVDSNTKVYAQTFPFNDARPMVHSFGANVTLLDGHVERVPFKVLWAVDKNNNVTCPYWYLKQY